MDVEISDLRSVTERLLEAYTSVCNVIESGLAHDLDRLGFWDKE